MRQGYLTAGGRRKLSFTVRELNHKFKWFDLSRLIKADICWDLECACLRASTQVRGHNLEPWVGIDARHIPVIGTCLEDEIWHIRFCCGKLICNTCWIFLRSDEWGEAVPAVTIRDISNVNFKSLSELNLVCRIWRLGPNRAVNCRVRYTLEIFYRKLLQFWISCHFSLTFGRENLSKVHCVDAYWSHAGIERYLSWICWSVISEVRFVNDVVCAVFQRGHKQSLRTPAKLCATWASTTIT
jgi:hypothetical protein